MTVHNLNSRRRNCFSWEAPHAWERHRGLRSARPSCEAHNPGDVPMASSKQSKPASFTSYRTFMGHQPIQHKYGSDNSMGTWLQQSSRSGCTATNSSLLSQRLQCVLLDAARLAEHDKQQGVHGPISASPHSLTDSSTSCDDEGILRDGSSELGASHRYGVQPAAVQPSSATDAASWQTHTTSYPPTSLPAPTNDTTPSAATATSAVGVQHKYRGALDAFLYSSLEQYCFPDVHWFAGSVNPLG
eukprot:GGOE01045472.1.p1 GENE.GGOE01045472.1~~GGOE01045472.1.p1  ORF type:complete len:244 (+),score=14.17 GGOE01045472.1:90-821(+)